MEYSAGAKEKKRRCNSPTYQGCEQLVVPNQDHASTQYRPCRSIALSSFSASASPPTCVKHMHRSQKNKHSVNDGCTVYHTRFSPACGSYERLVRLINVWRPRGRPRAWWRGKLSVSESIFFFRALRTGATGICTCGNKWLRLSIGGAQKSQPNKENGCQSDDFFFLTFSCPARASRNASLTSRGICFADPDTRTLALRSTIKLATKPACSRMRCWTYTRAPSGLSLEKAVCRERSTVPERAAQSSW